MLKQLSEKRLTKMNRREREIKKSRWLDTCTCVCVCGELADKK